jgi:hypothetical protein
MKNIDQVKSRIHKLLNMTKSENENEAKIALVQAQKLAMTYQLDLEDAIEEPKEDEFDQKNAFDWEREPVIWKHVVYILQGYYNVTVIYSPKYRGKRVSFIGRKSAIENAEVVSNYLLRTFDQLWKNYKTENNLSNRDKYSYLSGLERGVKDKLRESRTDTVKERAKELTGAVSEEKLIEKYNLAFKREDEKRDDFVGSLYPRLGKSSKRSSSFGFSSNVASDGFQAGRNINIGGKVAGYLG